MKARSQSAPRRVSDTPKCLSTAIPRRSRGHPKDTAHRHHAARRRVGGLNCAAAPTERSKVESSSRRLRRRYTLGTLWTLTVGGKTTTSFPYCDRRGRSSDFRTEMFSHICKTRGSCGTPRFFFFRARVECDGDVSREQIVIVFGGVRLRAYGDRCRSARLFPVVST